MDVKAQFPILNQTIHGKRLVYLDSAATSLKPLCVIEAERAYELEYCANIHRGVHALSERATAAYEGARDKLKAFVGASKRSEIILTTGTTQGINLVAQCYGRKFLKAGDEIWISSLEHHSNIVPWQVLCEQIGSVLRVIPLNHTGEIPFGKSAQFLSISYASNATGRINPVNDWIRQAKACGMTVLVDAAQAAPHVPLDVQALGCNFLVFSGHKVYGPTGAGVLYGREELLDQIPPYQTGGDMIDHVTFEKTTYAPLPAKFEAGTPNISGIIGLGAAIDFIGQVGFEKLMAHETDLSGYALECLDIPGLRRFARNDEQLPLISFTLQGTHPHDIASILDQEGICIRAGHLCAQPLMKLLGVPALARASLGIYNTRQDIDALYEGLLKVKRIFRC